MDDEQNWEWVMEFVWSIDLEIENNELSCLGLVEKISFVSDFLF